MGKIKDYCQDFLEGGGYDLGYDMDSLPELSQMDNIKTQKITVWEHKGVSEKEYYGGNTNGNDNDKTTSSCD